MQVHMIVIKFIEYMTFSTQKLDIGFLKKLFIEYFTFSFN